MSVPLIGREAEKQILYEALQSQEAEMVAVVGRRRVGKTFLIKTVYKHQIVFSISGELNAPLKEQLERFSYTIKEYAGAALPLSVPQNWQQAFMLLIEYLKTQDFTEKKVVLLDELPWLTSNDSGFLRGLSFFWNSWAVNQNIVVVVCGSAASWMIQNLVHHKGGLHNRITKRIFLKPFTLAETQQFFQNKGFVFNHKEIVELYMALGGIPHYLKEVKGDKSIVQNIDQLCFSDTGFLKDAFSKLYHALFDRAEKHIAIIRALASSKQGLPRHKIVEWSKIPENGNTSKVLEELEQSGFITSYFPFGKLKKNKLYRLTDEYSLFYLQFIENKIHVGSGTWHHLSQTQEYKTWSGYAFESICLKHIASIKKALGISGVYSLSSSFYQKATLDQLGVQIDLLLERADQIIQVFEIKFCNGIFFLTKETAESLQRKLRAFTEVTKTRKRLSLTLITTYGLKQSMYSSGLVEHVLTLDDLFLA
ncbi:MAG TPA: ATP-binding protein [Saprospiraceae bacterium]|nr:ATP-binding protein [Saprospiraceae bacterium]HMQ82320.1 ATP-binding protein [Saprospiraceae bacterium]